MLALLRSRPFCCVSDQNMSHHWKRAAMPITASRGAMKGIRDCAASTGCSWRRRPDDPAEHGAGVGVAQTSHSAHVSQMVGLGMLPSPATHSVELPVHAAPPFAAEVVRVYSSWPIVVQVEASAVDSSQSRGMLPSPARHTASGCRCTRRRDPMQSSQGVQLLADFSARGSICGRLVTVNRQRSVGIDQMPIDHLPRP